MADFKILDYLGVPQTPAPTASSQSKSSICVVAPREKPPQPTPRDTPQQQQQQSAASHVTAKVEPTGEVIEQKQKDGRIIRYHIYNSSVPSNWAYNEEVARKHKEDQRHHDAAPMHNALLFETSDAQPQKTASEKEAARLALQAFAEEHKKIKLSKLEEERRREKAEVEFLVMQEAQRIERENEMKAQKRKDAAESVKAMEAMKQLKAAERAREKELDSKINIGLGMNAALSEKAAKEAAIQKRQMLEDMWKRQVEERAVKEADEKRRTESLARLEYAKTEEEELAARRRQMEKRKEEEARLMLDREAHMKARTQRQHDEQAALVRQMMMMEREEEQRQAAEMEKQRKMKEEFRTGIERQIQNKKDRAESERHSQCASVEGTEEVEDRILFRCPVSGKLLPPENFNVPLSARNTFHQSY